MAKCLCCRPIIRSTEGADHTGRDFFLRCQKCGTRTTNHVEANYPGEAEPMLRKEWRAGRLSSGPVGSAYPEGS